MRTLKTVNYLGKEAKKKKKWDPNPWAVCMSNISKKDEPDKFERCVMDVKKKQK